MHVTVADLMKKQVLTAEPHHTVERLRRIMEKNNLHAIPIVDHSGEVKGIITTVDLARSVKDHTPASHIMTERVYTIPQYNTIEHAARLMRNHHVHHVVVTHEKRIVGIVSSYDLLRLVEDHAFIMKPGTSKPHHQEAEKKEKPS